MRESIRVLRGFAGGSGLADHAEFILLFRAYFRKMNRFRTCIWYRLRGSVTLEEKVVEWSMERAEKENFILLQLVGTCFMFIIFL